MQKQLFSPGSVAAMSPSLGGKRKIITAVYITGVPGELSVKYGVLNNDGPARGQLEVSEGSLVPCDDSKMINISVEEAAEVQASGDHIFLRRRTEDDNERDFYWIRRRLTIEDVPELQELIDTLKRRSTR